MNEIRIVADENIPNVIERFSGLGSVKTVNGRALTSDQLQDVDVLLVRSVTPVAASLLAGTGVRFVGTATIGVDHLDTTYLDDHGIHWVSAPGSNADSVADYVISSLCRLDGVIGSLLRGATVGIVGMGNVGSRVYQRLSRLGIKCYGYDPLIEQDRYPVMTDLETVLAADVICLHTPLTTTGDFPSYHLLDKEKLASLQSGTVLINAGRGAVIDNQALKQLLEQRDDLCVVLDVWEPEPDIDIELMKRVDIATPHIAGYSLDGKLAGCEMLYQACCEFLGVLACDSSHDQGQLLSLHLQKTHLLDEGLIEAVLACYDVGLDDQRLRGSILHGADSDRGSIFDQLRKHYPVRREISQYQINHTGKLVPALRDALTALGFVLIE
ncbi:4-phosphoerythronate dehydrogenase [Oceanicoccus sp. KOV_DT_Chl]|uniref:4-phosphoerythronate dehydrogenase n=1 Tax=Oceanicoccus sp. KOV_DT_Chl TaxID=1904639 RepID=UPI001F3743E7|nr:4-phosphoerythronate dehydrogenase [Oceanicoccus sp. KOV_DT_Chl]